MQLPVITPSKYISPSSFMEWRACPYKFYISRLAGYPYIKQEQSRAAAIGSTFDANAKVGLAEQFRIIKPTIKLDRLLAENVTYPGQIDDLNSVIALGQQIWIWYSRYNHFEKYKSGYIDFELELFKIVNGIPLFGKLDANINDYPFDWKLTGGNLTSGWTHRSDTGHYHPDRTLPLEMHNIYWAIQMLFYNWLLGNSNSNIRCTIHQIKYDEKHQKYILATHENRYISEEFADTIWEELETMWNTINQLECDIPEPLPHHRICEAFNQLCKVAFRCDWYKRTLVDEERRKNYV